MTRLIRALLDVARIALADGPTVADPRDVYRHPERVQP